MLSSGQLLADRYRLVRCIAVGGMGEVWEATDSRLDRAVAVKVLKPELSGAAEFLHRFRTEARMTASLNHPGIAAVHDYGETTVAPDGQADDGKRDIAYLVMELVEGDPLATLLARHGRLSADLTLDILRQAGQALQAAHEQGYVHRDVKPGNILLTPAGRVKLTDFGIAKAADAVPVTHSGMVMGTAHYIAPEQATGQDAEPASDVYSLAVVGYECLAGHRPFLSESAVTVAMMHIREPPPTLPADVPPAARALIEATLVKDPRQRYRSGGEFAAAVAAAQAGLPLPIPSGVGVLTPGPMGTPPAHPHPLSPRPPVLAAVPVIPPQGSPAGVPTPASTGTFLLGPPPQTDQSKAGQRRIGLWVLLAVLVIVLVGLLTAWGLRAWLSSETTGTGSPAETARRTTAGMPGESEDSQAVFTAGVTRQFTQQGLGPPAWTTMAREPRDQERCRVNAATPNGSVPHRSQVTVLCSGQAPDG
ncbi:MAG: protein kinase [Kutzneria sp.]|nr:protein kinase [Kutzneria sp.]